jgi:hypothetical protein
MFIAGINPSKVWTSQEFLDGMVGFPLGAVGMDHLGRAYQLVRMDAGGATAAGYAVAIPTSAVGDMLDTTNSAPGASAGARVGVAMAAIPALGVGWVCIFGSGVPVWVLASAVKGTLLNSTGTAGALDDDATASSEVINGITLDATRGGTAGVANATITWPTIGRTL